MQANALKEIEKLFYVSTLYKPSSANPADANSASASPTSCTVAFALRGMPTHAGEKPSLIDCSSNPTAEINTNGSDLSLRHWLTFPDSFSAYAPRETFSQAALQAAALNLPAAF